MIITQPGKPVAERRPPTPRGVRSGISAYETLRAGRDALRPIAVTSVEFLDAMYEEGADRASR